MNRTRGWPAGVTGRCRRLVTARGAPVVVAAALGLLAVAESIGRTVGSGAGAEFAVVLYVLALATTLPLAVPRPAVSALAVCAASVLSLAPFHSLTVAGGCVLLVVLYRLGRAGSQVLAVGLSLPFLVLALAGGAHGESRVLTVLLAVLAPAAAWAGITRRVRSEARVHDATLRVAASTLLEHSARGERARIARELHDVVAHHISMIAVQAETARLTTAGMPAAGAERLSAIGDTARSALTEMRRLLGVLREDIEGAGGAGGAEGAVAERQPQPGLRQLNELLDQARDASRTGTRLILRGTPDPLDPGVELAAYRIVQEALTNARRHAPGAAVDVELHYTDDALRLRIRDNGPGPDTDPPVEGHGLLGMRERAAAVGGRLSTGAAAGGGFLVETVLPAKIELPG